LKQADIEGIERDLQKIDRRLSKYREVALNVRISGDHGNPNLQAVLELDYGRNHLRAKAEGPDAGRAVREAREDMLRQINDRSRKGHSWFAKRR